MLFDKKRKDGDCMFVQIEVTSFLEKMREILSKVLCEECLEIPISLDTYLINGVGMNGLDLSSIDYVDFLVSVENEYDIIYDFSARIYTVGDIYNYISSYMARQVNHNE